MKDIYISTQTKIAYLNMPIELYKVFELKVMDYLILLMVQ